MLDLIIKNGKCYIDGELKDVAVAVKDGKISQIGQISEDAKETTITPTRTSIMKPASKPINNAIGNDSEVSTMYKIK